MKRRFTIHKYIESLLRLSLTMMLLVLFTIPGIAQFAGGSGTEADPYQIETLEQLQEIQNHLDKHFIQTADIDASDTENWNDGAGFEPIGGALSKFTGTYDGNQYIVSKLLINRPNKIFVGLFGFTDEATLTNISIEDAKVEGDQKVGIMIGEAQNSEISHCKVQGTAKSNDYAGGLIGATNRSPISYSSSYIDTSYSRRFGGLVGNNSNSDIYRSFTDGQFRGGGIVGNVNNDSNIEESFSKAKIISGYGLIGNEHTGGRILNSYYSGLITGSAGLVSWINTNATLQNSFSAPEPGSNVSAGLVRRHSGRIFGSYWDAETSNQLIGISDEGGRFTDITPLTTQSMTGLNAVKNMTELDFENTWAAIPGEYPKLLWTIPYMDLQLNSPDTLLASIGEQLNLEYTALNKGGVDTTLKVYLLNNEMVAIDSTQNQKFPSEEQFSKTFIYDIEEGDVGINNFYIVSQYDTLSINVEVLSKPGYVQLLKPKKDTSNISIDPLFEWKAAKLSDSYQFQLATDGGFENIITNQSNLVDTVYTPENSLDYLTTYFWRVRGVSENLGNGAWSDTLSFTTIIEKPENVTLISPDSGSNNISVAPTLSWDVAARAESYTFEISGQSSFSATLQTIDTSATSIQIDELGYNTAYFWRVKATNEGGESEYSSTWSFFTEYALPQVTLDSPADDSVDMSTSPTLFWNPVSDANEYELLVATDSLFEQPLNISTFAKKQQDQKIAEWLVAEKLNGLRYETEYFWTVRAIGEEGISNWSDTLSFTTKKAPLGEIVELAAPSNNAEEVSIPITLSWNSFDNAVSYEVDVSFASDFSESLKLSGLENTQVEVSNFLTDTTNYFWRVRAKVDDQVSEWSQVFSFKTELRTPATPIYTPENNASDVSVTPELAWGTVERAENYDLELSLSSDFESLDISETGLADTSYTINEALEGGSTYFWRVRGTNQAGSGNWSEALSFTTKIATSVDTEQHPYKFALNQNYPNPFNPTTQIVYSLAESVPVRLEVFSLLGKKVATLVDKRQSAGNYSIEFNAMNLSSGIYIYKLQAGEFTSVNQMTLIK